MKNGRLLRSVLSQVFFVTLFLMVGHFGLAIDDADLEKRYTTDWLTGTDLPLFFHAGAFLEPEKAKDLRKGAEIEVTKRLTCQDASFDPARLYKILRGEHANKMKAYSNFIALNTCTECQAYSTTFGIDEMAWDEASHAVREEMPYVWFSIEKDRYPVNPITGQRQLLQGRDLMDDYYFDSPTYLLQDNGYTVRGRRRWQSWSPLGVPELQRLLVAFKQTKGMDPDTGREVGTDPTTGLKTARKVDDRTRLNQTITPEDGQRLVEDVMSGSALWTKRGVRGVAKLHQFLSSNCRIDKAEDCFTAPGLACTEEEVLNQVSLEFCQYETDTTTLGGKCGQSFPGDVERLCSARAPLEPIAKLYQDLKANETLDQGSKFKDVLALEPKAFVRSLRGRYHLIEVPIHQLLKLF
ncbi:MAG: hypothetical protein AAF202_10155, partial [Pseudomonadota bacterium]